MLQLRPISFPFWSSEAFGARFGSMKFETNKGPKVWWKLGVVAITWLHQLKPFPTSEANVQIKGIPAGSHKVLPLESYIPVPLQNPSLLGSECPSGTRRFIRSITLCSCMPKMSKEKQLVRISYIYIYLKRLKKNAAIKHIQVKLTCVRIQLPSKIQPYPSPCFLLRFFLGRDLLWQPYGMQRSCGRSFFS